jgi:hypothetical protein
MFSSSNACLIIANVSVALFPRFAQNLVLFLCRTHREIASGQINDSKNKDVKNEHVTQMSETLYTDSQDMLPSTILFSVGRGLESSSPLSPRVREGLTQQYSPFPQLHHHGGRA